MKQIIFGRIISGTGAAGMVSLVSILISGKLPLTYFSKMETNTYLQILSLYKKWLLIAAT